MKKSLLAMALVSAFAAPAFAQNVEVYGVVDVGVQHTDNGTTTVTDMKSSGQSESRIGFKGGENLGGGLKAEFLLEAGLDVTNGSNAQAGTLFGRQSWVGLTSDTMGSVRLGRQLTSVYTTAYAIDPTRVGLNGGVSQLMDGTSNQLDKAVTYTSPSMGGFKAEVQYGFSGVDSESQGRTLSLGGSYAAGPMMVTGVRSVKNADGVNAKTTDTLIGGTYDLQQVKLHAAWGESKEEGSNKAKSYMLGASAPMGAKGSVMASWTNVKVDNVADTKSDVYSVAYTYGLSKRTNVYASYAYTANDAQADLGGASAAGKDVSKYAVGVRHSF